MFEKILAKLYKFKNFEEFSKNNSFELIRNLFNAWNFTNVNEYNKIETVLKHFSNIFISEKLYSSALDLYNIQIDYFLNNYDHDKLVAAITQHSNVHNHITKSLKTSTPNLEPNLKRFNENFLLHLHNSFTFINNHLNELVEEENEEKTKHLAILRQIINLQAEHLNNYLSCMYGNIESLFNKTKVQSVTDDLTKLNNRRYLNNHYQRYFLLANRLKINLFLILIDLDKFKRINDNYGHHKGDEVLQKIGQVIKDTVRESDIKIRIGGDEFVILLFGQQESDTQKTAQHILDRITALEFISDSDEVFHIRASVGISTNIIKHGEQKKNYKMHFQEMIKEADQAMYYSKENIEKITIYTDKIKTFK